MRHQSATAHELARIELLAGLPGEALALLGERMERRTLHPGERVVGQGDDGDRFYVVLAGLLRASQAERGRRGMLRPGDYFGEVSLLMRVPRTATVEAITPATVASCDRTTFDELVRPLFVTESPDEANLSS
ncbi:MAG: cyclic nucleotide-binding domain-containing protein [Thermoleophilia bacterium]|nr:cyclic nucleotide-binding domain-containing protein [Thermoleophilia bacterium]